MPDHSQPDHEAVPVEPESENWRAWLLGAFFSVTVLLGGAGYQGLTARLSVLEEKGSPPFRERMASIESQLVSLQRQQDSDAREARVTMIRLESKLDEALARLHMIKIPGYRPGEP